MKQACSFLSFHLLPFPFAFAFCLSPSPSRLPFAFTSHSFSKVWTIFCKLTTKISADTVTPGSLRSMRALNRQWRTLCLQHLPATARSFYFHGTKHLIDSIAQFGPVRGFWCFRGERCVGTAAAAIKKTNMPEANLDQILKNSKRARRSAGLSAQGSEFLESAMGEGHPKGVQRAAKRLKAQRCGESTRRNHARYQPAS